MWFVTLVFYMVKARSVMKLEGKCHIEIMDYIQLSSGVRFHLRATSLVMKKPVTWIIETKEARLSQF